MEENGGLAGGSEKDVNEPAAANTALQCSCNKWLNGAMF